MKEISIGDILSSTDIKTAIKLYKQCKLDNSMSIFAATCCELIILPRIDAINEKLGQENNAMFLAYAVEYALMRSEGSI